MSKSSFERNAANCMQFAQEAGDAVLNSGWPSRTDAAVRMRANVRDGDYRLRGRLARASAP